MVCVYSLSYAPALLDLDLQTQRMEAAASVRQPSNGVAQRPANSTLPGDSASDMESPLPVEPLVADVDAQRKWHPWSGSRAGLLFYLVLLAQLSDVFQYVWSKLLGRRVIAPAINASKTWEGFLAGAASTTLVGTLLWWATPFTIWQSACMSLVIAIMGFAGSMTMSAIKRDRGVKDYGTLVEGHAGVLDRVDSICFAAPVFFHLTRYFFMLLPLEISG